MPTYTTTLTADNGLSLTVLAGEQSPLISNGYGSWDKVQRPRRSSILRYKGRDLFLQDITLRFDGFKNTTSQEGPIAILEKMATQAVNLALPPKIKLSGIALHKEKTWVIDDITWSGQDMLATIGGDIVRIRADCTVHLCEYIDDTIISTPSSPAISKQTGKKKVTITTPKGMTLKQIAMAQYKDATRGVQLILQANPWLNPDPRALVPEGTPLTIPDPTTGLATTFIVP